MRSLILHVNEFATEVIAKSNWPAGIQPEERKSLTENMKECLVTFFCLEKGDCEKQLEELYQEILKTAREVQTFNLMISPFVHLSKNIAEPNVAKQLYEKLVKKFEGTDFTIKTSHFGYHKSLLLHIKGHPGSFRYREFY